MKVKESGGPECDGSTVAAIVADVESEIAKMSPKGIDLGGERG